MGRSFEVRKNAMAKTQGAKIKVYSKYGKEIYMCAKNGGGDPDSNLSLRHLMNKAKKDQVPSHIIEKAIEKASGGLGENYEAARYEGFGPGGCNVIVDCLTDNNKRTYQDVRQCFVKNDAKIGNPGTVSHMFKHQAVFIFNGEEEAALELLMEMNAEVEDIEQDGDIVKVFLPQTEFFKAKTALQSLVGENGFITEEITFVPQNYTTIEGEDIISFEKFLAMLEDCDDVQQVYHNAEIE